MLKYLQRMHSLLRVTAAPVVPQYELKSETVVPKRPRAQEASTALLSVRPTKQPRQAELCQPTIADQPAAAVPCMTVTPPVDTLGCMVAVVPEEPVEEPVDLVNVPPETLAPCLSTAHESSPADLCLYEPHDASDLRDVPHDRAAILADLLLLVDTQQEEKQGPFRKQREACHRIMARSVGLPLIVVRQQQALARDATQGIHMVEFRSAQLRQQLHKTARTVKPLSECCVAFRKLVPDAPHDLLDSKTEAKVRNAMFEFDRCATCEGPLHMIVSAHSLVCPTCGSLTECPDPGSMALSVTYFNLDRRPSLLVHRRLSKLKDFLKQMLAKQKSIVPISVVVDVTAHLSQTLLLHEKPTYKQTRAALLSLGMRNFMGYCTQIHCRICGCNPPIVTPSQEEALSVLFVSIQEPFEDLKERSCSTFFSISYVALTLCKFLGFDHLLPFISLGSTRMKVETQELLLEKVFERLGWTHFPKLTPKELIEAHS
jgi:hypothetical protein